MSDDYAWLRDKENPDVTAYLEAENAYADAAMAPLAELREELYQEMLSHIKQTDVSVPHRDGDWWYDSRTEEGWRAREDERRAARIFVRLCVISRRGSALRQRTGEFTKACGLMLGSTPAGMPMSTRTIFPQGVAPCREGGRASA